MVHPLLKIGAAFALGGAVFACPAFAVSPPSPDASPSLLIAVEDEENAEVWHDLLPDVTPPPARGFTKGIALDLPAMEKDSVR